VPTGACNYPRTHAEQLEDDTWTPTCRSVSTMSSVAPPDTRGAPPDLVSQWQAANGWRLWYLPGATEVPRTGLTATVKVPSGKPVRATRANAA